MSTATLSADRIKKLLEPYYAQPDSLLLERLRLYLDLLLKWNGRTNLTAIREPEAIVQRHFGESLFAARHVPASAKTLLDLGSGAGFPGIPVGLARPDLQVTLAESQNKKATFLREALRTLNLSATVWAARAETLPPTLRFDVVTMRAVDEPEKAMAVAGMLLADRGTLLLMSSAAPGASVSFPMPLADATSVFLFKR